MWNVSDRVVEKFKTQILYSVTFLFENCAVYKIIWKNTVEPDSPQMTIYHAACAFYGMYLRLHTHTLRICTSYCSSTAKMVARMYLSGMLYAHCRPYFLSAVWYTTTKLVFLVALNFRHRASCILGQAFHYCPENAFYIFNQQIHIISLSDICLTVHHWYK